MHICSDPPDSYSHSLRGAAMLLSVVEVLLAAMLVLGLCAVFWLWAEWFWPAWIGLPAGFCAWLGLFGGLEASMLLPMLLPSCSRLMCRTTAVALNACWREDGNGRMKFIKVIGITTCDIQEQYWYNAAKASDKKTIVNNIYPPFTLGEVLPDLSADWLMDVLAESRIPRDPNVYTQTSTQILCLHLWQYINIYIVSLFDTVCACVCMYGCVSHQGCLSAWSQVKRLAGSFSIRLPMKSLAERKRKFKHFRHTNTNTNTK